MEKQKRRELAEQYKRMDTHMGVIAITNNTNGKKFIAGFPNIKNKWLSQRTQLDMGRHVNSDLQKDWSELGMGGFSYEVLEEKAVEDTMDVKYEVRQMERRWLDNLKPYGDKGYNKPPKD